MKTATIYKTILPALCAAFLFVASPAMAGTASDMQLAQTVKASLLHANSVIDPLGLTVTANNGVVTLRGSVPGGMDQIHLVEGIASHAPGVAGINNQMLLRELN